MSASVYKPLSGYYTCETQSISVLFEYSLFNGCGYCQKEEEKGEICDITTVVGGGGKADCLLMDGVIYMAASGNLNSE